MSKIKGGNLMLFVNDGASGDVKSIAYATSHTLSISGDTQDTSNKDEGGGDWSANEVSTLSWTATSENLYSADGAGNNYADLFDALVGKKKLKAVFCTRATETPDDTKVPADGWNVSTTNSYEGEVVITSLELNAPNGEYATFTAQFTGIGALTRKNA